MPRSDVHYNNNNKHTRRFIGLFFVIVVIFSSVVECSPSSKESLKEGVEYLTQQRYEEAIQFFEEYLKEQPNSPAAYSNLGLGYWNSGNYAKSFYTFFKAIELGSNSAATHTNFAGLLCTIYPRWSSFQPSISRLFKRDKLPHSSQLSSLLSSDSSVRFLYFILFIYY